MVQMAAATKKGGVAQGSPNVCYVPAPPPPAGPGGVPQPFPSIADLSGCDQTVDKVLVEKKESIVEDSTVPSSKGDEAGVSNLPTPKGVVSQSNMGECAFKKYSSKVYFGGKKVVHHTAATTHNGSNPNMPAGVHASASQSKVLVAT